MYNSIIKHLSELVDCEPEVADIEIHSVVSLSADVTSGTLFLAVQGVNSDRHDYIDQAAAAGAVAAIVSKDGDYPIPVVKVANVNEVAGEIYSKWWGTPESRLQLIGITGTDGKTSVATITAQLLGTRTTGTIGTMGSCLADHQVPTVNTTPDVDKMYSYLAELEQLGAKRVVLELSSEAEYYGRLSSLKFQAIGVTNITSDHLNTHNTIEQYVLAKTAILLHRTATNGVVVLNSSDAHFEQVLQSIQTSRPDLQVLTYGERSTDNLSIQSIQLSASSTQFELVYQSRTYYVSSPLLARFNVDNLACSLLLALSQGATLTKLLQNVGQLHIPGRLEVLNTQQGYTVIVDYAHTVNGITSLLNFVRQLPEVKRMLVVGGAAGDRDQSKRAIIGEVVTQIANKMYLTIEDPGTEDIDTIFNQITSGVVQENLYKVQIITDRQLAIHQAILDAELGDVVVLYGLGAQTYQKIGEKRVPFSDHDCAMYQIELRNLTKN